MASPDVSVIIPTLNEGENLPVLIPRIAEALSGRSYEILIVDDNSPDTTPQVCTELSRTYPVRLIVRPHPRNGLSGAVLEGMSQAGGRFLVVMDADLQHPPQRIPSLIEPLEKDQADFVLGSRYVPGGQTAERWGWGRRINSAVATFLARPFAGGVRDPMSGFFAIERSTYCRAERLTPLGYKIALELMCKCRVKRPLEIPIHFDLRERGQSKLTIHQQFRYLEHLSRLYDFQYPRASPVVKFLVVLLLSWLIGAGTYVLLTLMQIGPVARAPLAYLPALFITWIFHVRYVRTQREFLVRKRPWLDFCSISACEWLACWLASAWMLWRIPAPRSVELFVIPFACATVVRYILRKELLADIRGLRRLMSLP